MLGIGPDKTGDLVPEVYERLKGIGEWMKVNGEGIYGTVTNDIYESGNWRFTKRRKDKSVYAFYLPAENEINISKQILLPQLKPLIKSKIYLLGYDKPIKWQAAQDGINITIPGEISEKLKSQPALAFKVQTAK